jgi:hypothetical protein
MATEALANLARIGQLKAEAPNLSEVHRMLLQGKTRWADAQLSDASVDGRFTSVYGAAHAAALAALRWHGYRSENRFIVFQCLPHTLGWPAPRWRVLDAAHQKRNLAEYEGYLDIEESMVLELVALVRDLIDDVEKLVSGIGSTE